MVQLWLLLECFESSLIISPLMPQNNNKLSFDVIGRKVQWQMLMSRIDACVNDLISKQIMSRSCMRWPDGGTWREPD